jgi:Flp pilus assembly protein protease CpaA
MVMVVCCVWIGFHCLSIFSSFSAAASAAFAKSFPTPSLALKGSGNYAEILTVVMVLHFRVSQLKQVKSAFLHGVVTTMLCGKLAYNGGVLSCNGRLV